MSKRLDTDGQAQAILFAEVHGDPAACTRYKISDRTLRNYRALARTEGSELSETFRRYAEAVSTERKAASFADWLRRRVEETSDILIEKARTINAANPEGLRAINEHMASLLEHAAALEYIGSLFNGGEDATT